MNLSEILMLVSYALGIILVVYLVYTMFNSEVIEEEVEDDTLWQGNEHRVFRQEPIQDWNTSLKEDQIADGNISNESNIPQNTPQEVVDVIIEEPVKVAPKAPRKPRIPKK